MVISIIFLLVVITALTIEAIITRRNIMSIKTRIHINGTRGKSSVTQYVATGLRENNNKILAKITGTKPTIIKPNGEKKIIKRVSSARVQEQFGIFQYAKNNRIDTLVLECMSIAPELQKLESKFYRPHIYVITNIRNDHQEVMGATIKEQANSICNAIPKNSKIITNEKEFLNLIKTKAKKKNSIIITPKKLENIEHIPKGIIAENIEIALTICEEAGTDKNTALNRILETVKDKEQMFTKIKIKNKTFLFINGFEVNDINSAQMFLDDVSEKYKNKINFIFNTRNDRPLRTISFAKFIALNKFSKKVILTGNHKNKAKTELKKAGFKQTDIIFWNTKNINNFKQDFYTNFEDNSTIIGIGNIANAGFQILDQLKTQEINNQ